MNGGNITDISQEEGVKLITKYWSNMKERVNSDICIVGDVHGDLNQFLAPLVMLGIITLTGEVTTIDDIPLPSYTINSTDKRVIYLGDMIDEWIFGRQVVRMLRDLLEKTKNITYIYGNHDVALIGRYQLFKDGLLTIPFDLPPLWETLKSELNYRRDIKIYGTKIEKDGSVEKGEKFLQQYLTPLFEDLYWIFSHEKGQVSKACMINGESFIISHSTWTLGALRQLNEGQTSMTERPSDKVNSQLLPAIDGKNVNERSDIISDIIRVRQCPTDKYQSLSTECNRLFHSRSRLFVSRNAITYTRNKEGIFLNQITGHTPGSEWRDIGVNVGPSRFHDEREKKLVPESINGKKVYYFDFNCSAGYDHDELSRPDFVYVREEGLGVTDLPSFNFVLSNGKQAMMVAADKTPHSKNKSVMEGCHR